MAQNNLANMLLYNNKAISLQVCYYSQITNNYLTHSDYDIIRYT